MAEIESVESCISHDGFEIPVLKGVVAGQVEVPWNSVDHDVAKELAAFFVQKGLNCLVPVDFPNFGHDIVRSCRRVPHDLSF